MLCERGGYCKNGDLLVCQRHYDFLRKHTITGLKEGDDVQSVVYDIWEELEGKGVPPIDRNQFTELFTPYVELQVIDVADIVLFISMLLLL
jgi:hypothetical protein